MRTRTFLTAEWRDLAMLNYEVEAGLLRPYLPRGVELDSHNGSTLITLVGFRFLRTKFRGVSVPFHRNFNEVNLRFYVRRAAGAEVRRGVVFVREIVPRRAIAAVARLVYNENYVRLPMRHSVRHAARAGEAEAARPGIEVEYAWRLRGRWSSLSARGAGAPVRPAEGSLDQFITEHYWGYVVGRGGGTLEYQVMHEPWRVWTAAEAAFEGDATPLYGRELAAALRRPPHSAFLAEGSPVRVLAGRRIEEDRSCE